MTYQRERDPLIYARFLGCPVCKRVSFPVDAEWLDDELILATYPSACSHRSTVTAVIEVRGLVIDTAFAETERFLPGRRCAGFTTRGHRCRAFARPGSDFCSAHPVYTEGKRQ